MTFTAAETTTTAFDPNGNKTQVSVLNGTAGSAAMSYSRTGKGRKCSMRVKLSPATNEERARIQAEMKGWIVVDVYHLEGVGKACVRI
jgi:hypothetical protein